MKLTEFLKQNEATGPARFYMPGHKGRYPLNGSYDITEITGADSLYHADGVLRETERRFERLYGARTTVLSAGGTTLCIQGMLAAVRQKYGVRRILAARNVHVAFLNACTLLDMDVAWVYPRPYDAFGVSGQVSPEQLRAALAREKGIGAVYITSPDYYGMRSDIAGLAAVCREADVPLLVDNAHGAHLKFLPEDTHPIALGAALCCDGAHKTLPVLTGGALLHAAADFTAEELKAAMALFGSTSPSYLIMQSLDACADYLETRARREFAALAARLDGVRARARQKGLFVFDSEPARVALGGVPEEGTDLAAFLRRQGVEYDYSAGDTAVLMPTPFNSEEEFAMLDAAIEAFCPAPKPPRYEPVSPVMPERVCSLQEAAFAPAEELPVEQCLGRVAAESKITCPPGVAIVAAGERIGADAQKLLKKCGIHRLKVV
ncbi:MAG: hypothetical protein ACOX6U_10000 [Oscillospiraceae bacterium]|jgi:arginine decarboxylase